MARIFKHTATFTGSGCFPFDMLRYDSCFPVTSEAVLQLTQDDKFLIPGEIEKRSVSLARFSDHGTPERAWTLERWQSFGWVGMEFKTEIVK